MSPTYRSCVVRYTVFMFKNVGFFLFCDCISRYKLLKKNILSFRHKKLCDTNLNSFRKNNGKFIKNNESRTIRLIICCRTALNLLSLFCVYIFI